jgi:hypothetical protein
LIWLKHLRGPDFSEPLTQVKALRRHGVQSRPVDLKAIP